MATQAPPAAAAVPAEQQDQGGWGSMFQQFIRMFMVYQVMGMGMRFFKGEDTSNSVDDKAVGSRTVGDVQLPAGLHGNLWQDFQEFDLFVYLSEHEEFTPGETDGELVWQQEDLYYAWSRPGNDRNLTITIPITTALQNNQSSLWAHVFATVSGSMDKTHGDVLYSKHAVVRKRKLKKMAELKSLFGEDSMAQAAAGILPDKPQWVEETEDETDDEDEPVMNHFIPELPFVIVHDFQKFKPNQLPAALLKHYEFDSTSNGYKPVHYVDEFWVLRRSWVPLNDTVTEVELKLSFYITSFLRFQMITQMRDTWAKQAEMGMQEEEETDTIVTMIMDNNPIFLGVTMAVTMLHSLFDCLAFKNDVQFWQRTKNLEGLSIRTVFLNCFCQVVIFLYLVENNTSYMILFSSGVGLLIEFWKVTKVSDVSLRKGGRLGYWIEIAEKENSGAMAETKRYDAEAVKYLSWAMYPLLFCYGIYSMFYKEHKGWYSFVLSTLVGFVYLFGFILMCPQLYINYKLQSVAHLPWRMLTYKFLNTIIDDLFAFLIEMPWLHRLSCFRDDAVFCVFLYQKWIYVTDMTRVNEFGLIPQPEGEAKKDAAVEGTSEVPTIKKAAELTGPAKERAQLVSDLAFLNTELRYWWGVASKRKAPVDDLTERMKKYNLEFEDLQNRVKTIDWKEHTSGALPKLLSTQDLNSGSNGDLAGSYNFVDAEDAVSVDPNDPASPLDAGLRQRKNAGETGEEESGLRQRKVQAEELSKDK